MICIFMFIFIFIYIYIYIYIYKENDLYLPCVRLYSLLQMIYSKSKLLIIINIPRRQIV